MLSHMAHDLLEKKWEWMRVVSKKWSGLSWNAGDVVAVERTCLHTHDPISGWKSANVTSF
jgi:hypothetical protein